MIHVKDLEQCPAHNKPHVYALWLLLFYIHTAFQVNFYYLRQKCIYNGSVQKDSPHDTVLNKQVRDYEKGDLTLKHSRMLEEALTQSIGNDLSLTTKSYSVVYHYTFIEGGDGRLRLHPPPPSELTANRNELGIRQTKFRIHRATVNHFTLETSKVLNHSPLTD